MVRNSRNRIKRIKIKSRRSSYRPRSREFTNVLDLNISVRTLVRYVGTFLAFVIVLSAVFLLGRLSADTSNHDSVTAQLSGETRQVQKEGTVELEQQEEEIESTPLDEEILEEEDDPPEDETEEDPVEYVYEPVVSGSDDYISTDEDDIEETDDEEDCTPKTAQFDYNYTSIDVSASNFQRTLKGDNWATIDSFLLTITNNEECTIVNPHQIKIKLNNKGKGSIWWDDEVFLPESFKKMKPGETKSEIIPVHVSYSDILSEKDFKVYVFDEYDIVMNIYKDYITLPG